VRKKLREKKRCASKPSAALRELLGMEQRHPGPPVLRPAISGKWKRWSARQCLEKNVAKMPQKKYMRTYTYC